jgi:hypothetical protein
MSGCQWMTRFFCSEIAGPSTAIQTLPVVDDALAFKAVDLLLQGLLRLNTNLNG